MGSAPRRWEAWLALVAVPGAAGLATLLVVVAASAGLAAPHPRHDPLAVPSRSSIDLPPMVPGDAVRSCQTVEIAPADRDAVVVRLAVHATGELAPYLDLTVLGGDAGSTCARPGVVALLYSGSLGGGTAPATDHTVVPAGTTVAYVFEVSLDPAAPDAAQGAHAALETTWEVVAGSDQPR